MINQGGSHFGTSSSSSSTPTITTSSLPEPTWTTPTSRSIYVNIPPQGFSVPASFSSSAMTSSSVGSPDLFSFLAGSRAWKSAVPSKLTRPEGKFKIPFFVSEEKKEKVPVFSRPTEAAGCLFIDFDETITRYHYWKILRNQEGKVGNIIKILGPSALKEWPPASQKLLGTTYDRSSWEAQFLMLTSAGAENFFDFLFGGRERIAQLIAFFTTLYEMGVNTYIISNGNTREIVPALQMAGIDPQLFRGVYAADNTRRFIEKWTPEEDKYVTEGRFGYKFEVMDRILKQGNCGDGPAVYIDDVTSEYSTVKRMGIITIGWPPRGYGVPPLGMSGEQMNLIVNIFVSAAKGCAGCGSLTTEKTLVK